MSTGSFEAINVYAKKQLPLQIIHNNICGEFGCDNAVSGVVEGERKDFIYHATAFLCSAHMNDFSRSSPIISINDWRDSMYRRKAECISAYNNLKIIDRAEYLETKLKTIDMDHVISLSNISIFTQNEQQF